MNNSPILDLDSDSIKDKVYVNTNIGGWFFDAFLRIDHTSSLTITEHPVQTGAAISDHAFVNPVSLTMEIGMSDVSKSFINGQFEDGRSRSLKALDVLKELQALRVPLQVTARIGSFKNLLIQTISVPDDYKTANGLRVTVTLKEIIVAEVTTVKISARPQTTDKTSRGNVEPVTPNESIGYQTLVLMFGEEKAKEIIAKINGLFPKDKGGSNRA